MWAVKCKFLNKVRLCCWDWYRAFKQFVFDIPVKYCWGYLTHLRILRSLLKGFIILFYLLTLGLRPSCFQYFCLILSVIGCWLNNLVCYWLLDLLNLSAFACCLFNNRVYFVSTFVCLIILSTSVRYSSIVAWDCVLCFFYMKQMNYYSVSYFYINIEIWTEFLYNHYQ